MTIEEKIQALIDRLEDLGDDMDNGVVTGEPAYWDGRFTASQALRELLAEEESSWSSATK